VHQRYHDDRDREAHGDGQIGIGEGFDLSLAIGQQPQLLDRGLLASQRIAQGGGVAAGDRRRLSQPLDTISAGRERCWALAQLRLALPFAAAEPMEWVHCHFARRPMAPARA